MAEILVGNLYTEWRIRNIFYKKILTTSFFFTVFSLDHSPFSVYVVHAVYTPNDTCNKLVIFENSYHNCKYTFQKSLFLFCILSESFFLLMVKIKDICGAYSSTEILSKHFLNVYHFFTNFV